MHYYELLWLPAKLKDFLFHGAFMCITTTLNDSKVLQTLLVIKIKLSWWSDLRHTRTSCLKHLGFSIQLYCVAISDNQQHETCLAVSLFFSNFSPASGVTDETNRWRCSRWSVEGLNMWQILELGRIDWGLDYANKSNIRALTSRTQSNDDQCIYEQFESQSSLLIWGFGGKQGEIWFARRQNISWWVLHQWLSGLLRSTSEGNFSEFFCHRDNNWLPTSGSNSCWRQTDQDTLSTSLG